MLDLVGMHLAGSPAWPWPTRGFDGLGDVDAFLTEALAAFEIAQRGFVESNRAAAAAKQRAELLRGLSEAYVKIATPTSLADRLEQVCVQAQQFLDAEDARLDFGRLRGRPTPVPTTSTRCPPSSTAAAADSSCRARRGRTWTDVDRATLAELAVLISAPIDDARRLDFTQRLEHIGALIGEAVDQQAIVDRLREACPADTGGRRCARCASRVTTGRSATSTASWPTWSPAAQAVFRNHDEDDAAEAALPLDAGSRRLGAVGLRFDEHQPFDLVQRGFLVQLADRIATRHGAGRVRTTASGWPARTPRWRRRGTASCRSWPPDWPAPRHAATSPSSCCAGPSRRRWPSVASIATFERGRRAEALATVRGAGQRVVVRRRAARRGPRRARAPRPAGGAGRPHPRLCAGASRPAASARSPPTRSGPGRRTIGVLGLGWAERHAAADLDALRQAQVAMAGPALLPGRALRPRPRHRRHAPAQLPVAPPIELPGVRWSVHYRPAAPAWPAATGTTSTRSTTTASPSRSATSSAAASQAAAVMGQLRSATRAIAALIDEPGELLAGPRRLRHGQRAGSLLVDRLRRARHREPESCATPSPGTRRRVLRLPDGTTALLESGHGPLLGVPCERTTASVTSRPAALLVLYTDGLVERRDELVDAGLARLVEAVDGAPTIDPEAMCAHLAAQLRPTDDVADDVAILALQRHPSSRGSRTGRRLRGDQCTNAISRGRGRGRGWRTCGRGRGGRGPRRSRPTRGSGEPAWRRAGRAACPSGGARRSRP